MRKQFDELKLTGKLPSPSGVGMQILRLTQDEDYSTSELTATIRSDPALSGRVLKMANSVGSSSVEPATTVAAAALRLGVTTVRNVALGFSLVSTYREGACRAFPYDAYWSDSLARAVSAQVLSRNLGTGAPAEAYVCGLFSGIGRLALACVHPEAYARILEARPPDDRRLIELEQDCFEIDHNEVSEALLADWGLPPAYGQAIAAHEYQERHLKGLSGDAAALAAVLRLARVLAAACTAGPDAHAGHWASLQTVQEALGTDKNDFLGLCQEVSRLWEEWGRFLQVPTPEPTEFHALEHRPPPLPEDAPSVHQPIDIPRPSRQQGEGLGLQRLRILAVDDDSVSLKILSLHLRRGGHDVLTATNGEEALRLALEMCPHVVVSDWMMPEMDGVALCRALRQFEFGRRLYMILLTGREDEDRVVEAFDAGVDDYLTKPFKPKVLLARVRAGLRVVQLQDQVAADQKKMHEQVAQLAVLNRKLQQASLTDVLTGLPNRRHAMQVLNDAWSLGKRTNAGISVIMMDIDHFKQVNDRYGHDVGDEVLRAAAAEFKRTTRQSDTVCRLGGEEFLVVCPQTTAQEAAVCAERLRTALHGRRIVCGPFDGRITISLGVAQDSPVMEGVDDLLKAADLAVYRAKDAGRNRVLLHTPEPAEV